MLTPESATQRWAVQTSTWEPTEQEWQFLLRVVGPIEQEKIQAFHFIDDRKRALVSRLLQLASVHRALGVPWEAIQIRYTRGKKPYFVSTQVDKSHAPNFNFNVSHEGDFIVLASEPLCLCGVDVSAPQTSRTSRSHTFQELLNAYRNQLTNTEWNTISRSGSDDESRLEAFQKFWSLKEAFVKARGDGLGFDFGRASFVIAPGHPAKATVSIDGQSQPKWRFQLSQMGNSHWVSVARGPVEDIVDAWQAFTATFNEPHPTPEQYKVALSTPWPPFVRMSVGDLLPAELQADYQQAGGTLLQQP